jgi:hypothetical protein
MPQVPATRHNIDYLERLARKATLLGKLDAHQASVLADVCMDSQVKDMSVNAEREIIADIRSAARVKLYVVAALECRRVCGHRDLRRHSHSFANTRGVYLSRCHVTSHIHPCVSCRRR